MPAPKQEIIFYSQKSRDALSKKINRYVNQPLPPTPRYSLHLMSQDSVLERNRIYVSTEQDKLKYKVIAPSGKLQEGEITTEELGGPTLNSSLTLGDLEPLLSDILNITSRRGHTQPKPIPKTANADFHRQNYLYGDKFRTKGKEDTTIENAQKVFFGKKSPKLLPKVHAFGGQVLDSFLLKELQNKCTPSEPLAQLFHLNLYFYDQKKPNIPIGHLLVSLPFVINNKEGFHVLNAKTKELTKIKDTTHLNVIKKALGLMEFKLPDAQIGKSFDLLSTTKYIEKHCTEAINAAVEEELGFPIEPICTAAAYSIPSDAPPEWKEEGTGRICVLPKNNPNVNWNIQEAFIQSHTSERPISADFIKENAASKTSEDNIKEAYALKNFKDYEAFIKNNTATNKASADNLKDSKNSDVPLSLKEQPVWLRTIINFLKGLKAIFLSQKKQDPSSQNSTPRMRN